MDNPIIETPEQEPNQAEQQAEQEKMALARKKMVLNARMRSGISWFFWVAGLAVINTVMFYFTGALNFIVGLGASALVDGFSQTLANELPDPNSTLTRLAGVAISIGIALIFVTFGWLGFKGYRRAVVVGMVLYAMDGLIFVWARVWYGLVFHIFVLWGMWTGLRAINNLKALKDAEPASIMSAAPIISEPGAWLRSDIVKVLTRVTLLYVFVLVVLAVWGFVQTR